MISFLHFNMSFFISKAQYRDYGVELKNPCLYEDSLALASLVTAL